jgi:hypothetical protein
MPLPDSDTTGIAVEHCRLWLGWAATQVDECLADDKPACDQLLCSLADVLGSVPAENARHPGDAAVSQKMAAVVVAVQCHDRVMQRLAHVADALRRVQDHLADSARARSTESWQKLQDGQLGRFSMAEERALFLRLVVQDVEAAQEDAAGSAGAAGAEDTIELFVADGGSGRP